MSHLARALVFGKYFSPDGDGGGGGSSSDGAGGTTGTSSGKTEDDATKSDSDGTSQKSGDVNETEKKFSQSDLNALAAKVRSEEKSKYEKLTADAAAAAKEADMKKQGEFEALWNASKAEVEELKLKQKDFDAVASRIQLSIDAEIKNWPEEVTATDPGPSDVVKRIEWLDKHRGLAKKLLDANKAPNGEYGSKKSTPTDVVGSIIEDASRYAVPGKKSG